MNVAFEHWLFSVDESFAPIEVDATVPTAPSGQIYTKARSLLRQYLEEVGYTEKILDVRSFRVKSLLGLVPDDELKLDAEAKCVFLLLCL